jgi:hypothetical protein
MSIAETRQGHIEQFEKCIHGYLQGKKVVHKAVEEEFVRENILFFLVRMGLSKGRGLFPTHLKLKEKILAVNKSSGAWNTFLIIFPIELLV